MEQQELISLVEDLLGSNAGGGQALRPATGADAPGAMTGLMAAATPIGIAIVDAATGRIMRVNTTFPRVMGIRQPPEAFGGVSLDRLGPTLAQPMVVTGLRQVIATGAPFSEIVPLAQTQPNPQPAYRRITISPVPRKGGSGQLLITVLDVTDQVLSHMRSEQAATDARDSAILHATGAPQAAPSRALEEQLRSLTEEKRSLEAMLARARDDARAELDRTQRELDHARRELEMHRGSTGGPDWQTGSGGALGTVIASSLTPGVALPTALDRVAQQLAEGLGDVCAIFFSGADGLLHVAAVHHCDPLVGSQLREFFEGRPPRPGEGAFGRVLDAGEGVVYEAVLPADLLDLFPGAGPQVAAAGVTSAVCVPLLGAMEPTGAILLLSISRERGGTERRFSRQTQNLLTAASAPLSLALYTERLRRTVETAEAQHDALVAALPSGVAMYDSMGRLRSLNESAERMLTAPGTKPALLQGFL
ncbi:MAG TPA: PAS domain-containing protein, partial [Ktedonobacterales bacterium]